MSSSYQLFRRPRAQLVLVPLIAALSMGVSHRAMAACVPDHTPLEEGDTVTCSTPTTATYSTLDALSLPVDGVTVDNTGTFTVNGGSANAQGVNLHGNDTTFINESGASLEVFGTDGTTSARAFIGVQTSALSGFEYEGVQVQNAGTIYVHTSGVGAARGVYGGEDIESLSVENSNTITAERTSSVTTSAPLITTTAASGVPVTFGPGNVPSAANVLAAKAAGNVLNLGDVAAVGSDDDVDEMTITNKAGATLEGKGDYAYGAYLRGADFTINNHGTIASTGGSVSNVAISSHGEGSGTLNNYGTVTGDIQFLDANGLKEQALREESSKFQLFDGSTTTPDAGKQFIILNQLGVRDSEINNFETGHINGNIYLGSGEHTIFNEGEIAGDISVDQRSIPGISDDGFTTDFHGDREFTFENAGSVGDVTVTTATTTGEEVTLLPHIFGGGAGSADTVNDSDSGFIDGQLKVWDGALNTLTDTTSIAPQFDATVKDGEWYTIATSVYGYGANTAINDLDVEETALVEWTARTNNTGELVIGAEVKNAFDIDGISKPGATTVNALIDAAGADPDLDALGGAVEQLKDDDDVAKAANQLAPETNYATQQAAITLNNAIGQHIDTRLASAGATGGYQGYVPGPSGLGMTQKQSDPGRMNLGGGLKDDSPDFVAPRSAALWGQAFGAGMNQDERESVDGYSAKLYGAIIGYDNWVSPNVRLGVAGGYANTRIDGDGDTTANHTDIDSYLVEAYGSVKGAGWYATGRTGYTHHSYDTSRVLTVPISDTATGGHDGDQYNASVEIGAPLRHDGTIFTPVASLTYSNLQQDAYTETSDGGMALSVGSQSNDSVVSALGLKALLPIAADTVLEGRAFWLHEFSDDAQIVTAAFAGGGGTFTAAGPAVGRDTAAVGGGLLAQVNANTYFELNYDANIRQDYLAHVGSARLNVDF